MPRGAALQHKIRKVTQGNETGDAFGITIPKAIAFNFSDVFLRVYESGNCIVLESGCKIH